MPLLQNFDLAITVDQVLRAQGADPAKIRQRSPMLVEFAERALEEGLPLLEPKVLYRELAIETLRHERLSLAEGNALKGRLIAQHLAPAQKVKVVLCTIGSTLEEVSSARISTDPVEGLALEGVGSAAVEALANLVCVNFEETAKAEGAQTTIPLSPGMIGWSVEEGQTQIFKLLDEDQAGVTLTSSYVMLPRKSITMVIGSGANIVVTGSTCDYCNLRETCQFKDHYAHANA